MIFGSTVSPVNFNDLPPEVQNAQLEAQIKTKNQQRKISFIVFAVTIVATGIAAYLVFMRARAVRPAVIAEMEARKLAQEEEEAAMAGAGSPSRRRSRRHRHGLSLSDSETSSQAPEFVDLMRWNESHDSDAFSSAS